MTATHPLPEGGDASVRHLDGNAIVGTFADLFTVDPSILVLTCAHCGAAGPLGGTVVEDDGRCAIVRCRACTRTLLTLIRKGEGVSFSIGALAQLDTPHPSATPEETSR